VRQAGGDLEEAARRVARGDVSAFATLVNATSARLYRLAIKMMGSGEEAEDVLQESYARAYEALRAGRFEGAARVDSWLYRIVANQAINALRSRRRRPAVTLQNDDIVADPRQASDVRVVLRELSGWLDALPADQRAALVLRELEGLPNAEIARIMGCSEGAVEQRLVRARAALRARSEQ